MGKRRMNQGRLAGREDVAAMWAHIAQGSMMDEGFMAKQADVMAGVVRMCKL